MKTSFTAKKTRISVKVSIKMELQIVGEVCVSSGTSCTNFRSLPFSLRPQTMSSKSSICVLSPEITNFSRAFTRRLNRWRSASPLFLLDASGRYHSAVVSNCMRWQYTSCDLIGCRRIVLVLVCIKINWLKRKSPTVTVKRIARDPLLSEVFSQRFLLIVLKTMALNKTHVKINLPKIFI